MKKILMVIAKNGFRDEEFQAPCEKFKADNIEVIVASSSLGQAKGKFGSTAEVDVVIGDANSAEFEAVVFVGGPGANEYFNNKVSHKIAREMFDSGKIVAAICIAPVTLANAGVLKGKKATVWSSSEDKFGIDQLKNYGAEFVDKPVVVDGNLVTANGPAAAADFASEILKRLK